MSNIFIGFIGLKKTCLGCFRIEEIREKDNGTGLKEGGGIEMSTTVQGGGIEMSNYSAFHIRDARSLSLKIHTTFSDVNNHRPSFG